MAKAETKTYRIAAESSLPPFSFLNEKGELQGISIDLMKTIARENNLMFEFMPMTRKEAETALHNGKVAAIAGISYSTERDRRFDFSASYFTMSHSFIIPNKNLNSIQKFTDLRNKHVVLEDRSSVVATMLNMRNTNLTLASNQYSGLLTLIEGRADVFIGNKWTAAYFLKQLDKEKDFTILDEVVEPADYAVAVREGDEELLRKINGTITNLKAKGELNILIDRWIMPKSDAEILRLEQFIRILTGILVTAALILLIIYIWNQRLKRAVNIQTSELQRLNKNLIEQQQNIADSNAFKELILNNVDTGIVTFDLQFNLTSCNASAIKIMRITPGKGPYDRSSTLLNELLEQCSQNLHLKNQSKVPQVLEISEKGLKKVIHYHLLQLYDSQKNQTGYLLSLNDVTEKKKLEQQLFTQEKLKALGQLVAGVAHEIRNPLTAIKAFIDVLPAKYDKPQFREMLMEHLPSEVNRLNTIVSGLVDFARPRQPVKQKCSVAELTALLSFLQFTIQKKRIIFEMKQEENLIFFIDPQQISQVLLNILLNAIDAVENSIEKKISVIIEKENDSEGRIIIKDTGNGIQQENMANIFEPFYTNKERGVGLGLTLSYNLVKENNGEIMVSSEVGNGTSFTILLPLYNKEGIE